MTSISAAPTSTTTSSEAVKSKNIMSSDPTASAAAATATSSSITPSVEDGTEQNISYSAERIIGNGSFGVVFEAKVVETNEVVAIKKVLQDKRFKNRELQIMRQLVKDPHTNIVALRHCFYSQVRRYERERERELTDSFCALPIRKITHTTAFRLLMLMLLLLELLL